jgi:hypothetical protein
MQTKKIFARAKEVRKTSEVVKAGNNGQPGKKGQPKTPIKVWMKKHKAIIAFGLLVFLGGIFLLLSRLWTSQKMFAQGTVPAIKTVYISPSEPTRIDKLSANLEMQGQSPERVLFRYQWYRNDIKIKEANRKILSHDYFDKGDTIKVAVTPVMMAVEGETVLSLPVTIRNNFPVMRKVTINPQIAYTNTDLSVDIEAEDKDQDKISYKYQWMKNGDDIRGQESAYLNHSYFAKGDRIQIKVTPYDGYAHGDSMTSGMHIINNSPPEIISDPSSNFEQDGAFTYKVIAKDLDKDSLTYKLVNSPPGAEIDSQNGLLLWKIPQDLEPGVKKIEIIVSDNDGGEASQWFTLNIEFAES